VDFFISPSLHHGKSTTTRRSTTTTPDAKAHAKRRSQAIKKGAGKPHDLDQWLLIRSQTTNEHFFIRTSEFTSEELKLGNEHLTYVMKDMFNVYLSEPDDPVTKLYDKIRRVTHSRRYQRQGRRAPDLPVTLAGFWRVEPDFGDTVLTRFPTRRDKKSKQ